MKRKLVIKLPDGVPPAVMDSFAALIPAAFAMTTFAIIHGIFKNTSYEYAHNFIYEVLQAPLVGIGRSNLFEVTYQSYQHYSGSSESTDQLLQIQYLLNP